MPGSLQPRLALVPAGQLNAQLRFGLLLGLYGARPIGGQVAITGLIDAGQLERRRVCRYHCLCLAYGGFLLDQVRLQAGDAGPGAGDLGLRRVHGSDEIAVVDGCQEVAFFHRLVVFDQYRLNRARYLRCYRSEVGMDVGIVRRLYRCTGFRTIEIEHSADGHREQCGADDLGFLR